LVVVSPLTELLGEQPLVEPVAAALMRVLCAVGRSAQALECYAAIRQRLSDELGTDPGTALQSLHRAVLAGELDGPSRDAVSIVVRPRRPSFREISMASSDGPPSWTGSTRSSARAGRKARR
jgi:DNA-binding SARP family transcriptional activator